jgi:hypothetical protein
MDAWTVRTPGRLPGNFAKKVAGTFPGKVPATFFAFGRSGALADGQVELPLVDAAKDADSDGLADSGRG